MTDEPLTTQKDQISSFEYTIFDDGIVVCGNCTNESIFDFVKNHISPHKFAAIVTDPPYGNILDDAWDKTKLTQQQFSDWMVGWFKVWLDLLPDGGAFYVWGGIGIPKFRPFFQFLADIETNKEFNVVLATLITWGKRRAYGVKNNFLFTREELAYFVKGKKNKPRVFNIPLLKKVRGYEGYNKKYPAKSEFLRRTNVWSDITEIFKGKTHPAEKAARVCEIPIEVSSNKDEWVLDLFGGSGSTAIAARKLGRKFVIIEKDKGSYNKIIAKLQPVV